VRVVAATTYTTLRHRLECWRKLDSRKCRATPKPESCASSDAPHAGEHDDAARLADSTSADEAMSRREFNRRLGAAAVGRAFTRRDTSRGIARTRVSELPRAQRISASSPPPSWWRCCNRRKSRRVR
jgi:hypothetical protein